MNSHQDSTPLPAITFLTQDEVRRLFAVIPGKRDHALFQLAYHHGLRASEVSLLQRDDVHEKQGRIFIPRVKGSIAKTYPMQPADLRCLRAYLRTREDDSPYLFISTRGIPLERRSYWDLMQKYGEIAALPKPKRRFHALRHAIAVHLLDAGADVAFVQDRLGHANIQNTHDGHPRCPDAAAVCQSSRGLNSSLRSQRPPTFSTLLIWCDFLALWTRYQRQAHPCVRAPVQH
jgi:site-specific recombinase XerD